MANSNNPNDLSNTQLHDLPLETSYGSSPQAAPRYKPEGLSNTEAVDLPLETSFAGSGSQAPGFTSGQVLAGRYALKEKLGAGGMGSVWSAHDRVTNFEVAVKVMSSGLMANADARKRFIKEAMLARTLTHEGIVKIYDVHESGDQLLIVMERLHGQNLGSWLKQYAERKERMGIAEALDIIKQLCEVLSYLHKRNVFHCDIKPDNVWLNGDGSIKLLDFGISKAMGQTLFQTMLHRAGGTAYYMAPEQLKGEEVDGRADQYALGVMLYQMLSNEIPQGRCDPLKEIRPELSKELSDAVDKAFSANRDKRYTDIASFMAALNISSAKMAVPSKKPSQATPKPQRPAEPATPIKNTAEEPNKQTSGTGSKTGLYAGLALAGFVVVGGGIWLGKGSSTPPQEEPPNHVEPVKVEPVKVEPPKVAEPVKVEPKAVKAAPITEPVKTEPANAKARKGYVSQGELTWMPITSKVRTWSEANAYCANTAINGQSGWRLPTKDELFSLYNSGAMNGQGWTLSNTWSSTPDGSGKHYYVNLDSGSVYSYFDTGSIYVTCVH